MNRRIDGGGKTGIEGSGEIAVGEGKENRVEVLEKLGTRKGQARAKGSYRESVIKDGGNLGKGGRKWEYSERPKKGKHNEKGCKKRD